MIIQRNLMLYPPFFPILLLAGVLTFQDLPGQDAQIPADSLLSMADRYLDNNEIPKAIPLLQLLLRQSKLSENLLRKTHSNLGFAYFRQAKYDSALHHYTKNLIINISQKDSARILRTQRNLGMTYQKQGLLGLANEQFNEAAILARELKDLPTLAEIYNSMGLVYHTAGDFKSAFSYHFKSLAGWRELSDSVKMAFAYNNIARCHHDSGNFDSSLYYNFSSLQIKMDMGSREDMASTINNIGTAFLALDSLAPAADYLFQSYWLHKELGNLSGLSASFNNLADLYHRKGAFSIAKAYLDSGSAILEQIQSKELLVENLALRVSLMETMGRNKEALAYHKELSELKQDIFQEEKLNVQKVESSYMLREKELERQAADRESLFAKAESRRYLQFIGILVVSVLVTVILLLLLFRFNRALKLKNNLIASHQEDLRHRTYNILMRIQSLIRMASKNLTDENSKLIMQNSEAAILSAASIQEHLTYQENSGAVLIGKYLMDLMGRLEEMFQLTGEPINYIVEIQDDALLPVNTVLNLGIIIAELVTNATKYAFNEQTLNPEIGLRMEKKNNHLIIQLRDNGVGIGKNPKVGTGTGLVQRMAGYIKAELDVSFGAGTFYTLKLNLG